ncbi:MAG: hypothetical protein O7D34_04495 [Ignavibacteria bacterium]|nr:hypothetical protein [Ignavibacteria bacterium]
MKNRCLHRSKVLFPFSSIPFLFFLGCSSSLSIVEWEYTGGPYAQNISTVHIDEDNPSHVYAGLTNGQVFKSTDRGRTWTSLSTIQVDRTIHRFVQHPEHRQRLYAATDAGLFVSNHNGGEWKRIVIHDNSGGSNPSRAFAIDPWKSTQMYVGLKGRGIYKSTNGGINWNECNNGLDSVTIAEADIFDIDIDQLKPDVVYASMSEIGVVKSTDAGGSWLPLTDALASSGSIPMHLVINQLSSESMCFGTNGGDIYKSTNTGTTWSPTRQGPGGGKIRSLAIHSAKQEVIYAGTESGLLVSTDFGTSWRELTDDLPHIATSVVLASDKNNPLIYVFGEGIGLQRSSDNGKTWLHVDVGLGGATVSNIVTDRSGGKVYGVVGQALFHHNKVAASWVSTCNALIGGTINSVAFDADSTSYLYAATMNGIYKTTNSGVSWTPGAKALRGIQVSYLDTQPAIRSRMYCSTKTGLMISTDRGESWTPTRPIAAKYQLRSLVFSPVNAGMIHAATSNKAVIATNDGGFNWEPARYGIVGDDILAVTSDDKDQKTYYAWTADGDGFRSTNSGLEWNRYSPPWKVGDKVHIAFDRYQPSDVVAIVNGIQVYYSQNGGATWMEIPTTKLRGEVRALHWSSNSSTLYAGLKGAGVYRLSLGDTIKRLLGD